jgi:hypothetical protein
LATIVLAFLWLYYFGSEHHRISFFYFAFLCKIQADFILSKGERIRIKKSILIDVKSLTNSNATN